MTVKNAPMFQGQYAVPEAIKATNVRCDGAGKIVGCPEGIAVGMRASSRDIEEGRYVGSVEAAEDGTFTVTMYPAETDFEGTTDVVFEDVSATVAFQTFEETSAVQNYSLAASNVGPTGRVVAVPPEGTKTSRGTLPTTFDDDRYRIPPRLPGREVEIVSAVSLYGGALGQRARRSGGSSTLARAHRPPGRGGP